MKSLSGKRGVIFAVLGLVIFAFSEAGGEDWRFYGRTDKYLCFYDMESLRHSSAPIVEVAGKQDYTHQGVNFMVGELGEKYENLSHSITMWQINCADKRFRFTSLAHYSKEKKVIYSWKVLYSSGSPDEWSVVIPGSLGERLCKAVCE
jgi:hypothetical protein